MKKTLAGIDDSKVNQAIFEEAARLLDINAVIAEDGQDGFDKIMKSINEGMKPNIIVTDINMPKMNGLELIKKLKENQSTKYIPILVLTTEKDEELKSQARKLGAAGWITKPLSADEVGNIAKKFL